MQNDNAAIAIDGGDLALGGGLLALVRPALDLLEPGGILAINSVNVALRDDLPRWCQLQHHEYQDRQRADPGYDRHLVARGPLSIPKGEREHGFTLPQRNGAISAEDILAAVLLTEGYVLRVLKESGTFYSYEIEGYGTRSVPATLPGRLRHTECACYFAGKATAHGVCLLLCREEHLQPWFVELSLPLPLGPWIWSSLLVECWPASRRNG
jgi:TusA-related sulfurtransferase